MTISSPGDSKPRLSTTHVAAELRRTASLLEFARAPKFKVRAYQRAAEVVTTVADLAPFVEQARLTELEGIGASLSKQIEELWNTGDSAFLQRLRAELPDGASDLIEVEGMTPKRLRAIHEALAVSSVEALREACARGAVREIPGFGPKTEARLLDACERWLGREPELVSPVLLSRARERVMVLERTLREAGLSSFVAGAVRRGVETTRTLDLVVVGDAGAAVRALAGLRQVLRIEEGAPVLHLSEGLRLEIHGATRERLGNALVLATGSDAHLARLRERGFDPSGAAFATENDLYRSLGLHCVPPELRSGLDELTRAERDDFTDLLRAEDIQGFVHCHTSYSDGRNSIAEMAAAAHALGMKYLTITDHSPTAHYAGGVTLDRLKQQWDEIAEAQASTPVRLLRGTEADIVADGALDYPDQILEQFDVVIASIHARYRMDRAAMTTRLKRALSLPVFKIWGHALGRILNHREPIDCDVPAVLEALAGSRGAIEINSDPHRLDLPPEWLPAARALGIPFVISVDAHSTRGLGVLHYGVTMARRGGLRRSEVLNTLPADEFAARVRPVSVA